MERSILSLSARESVDEILREAAPTALVALRKERDVMLIAPTQGWLRVALTGERRIEYCKSVGKAVEKKMSALRKKSGG